MEQMDPLAHDDYWLVSHFRFPRLVLLEMTAELQPLLERNTKRSHALAVHILVLTTLAFLATRTFQQELADQTRPCQSTLR